MFHVDLQQSSEDTDNKPVGPADIFVSYCWSNSEEAFKSKQVRARIQWTSFIMAIFRFIGNNPFCNLAGMGKIQEYIYTKVTRFGLTMLTLIQINNFVTLSETVEVGCLRHPGATTIGSQLQDGDRTDGWQNLTTQP